MSGIVCLFPGQGAQYPGMGKDFAEAFAIARETFEEADDVLGESLSKIIFEGPETELTKTKNSQLGIFVVSAALLRTMQSQFPAFKPAICAGLSLGEYTALWASGKLSFAETLKLIRHRAQFMNDACEAVPGTMAAVLGLEGAQVEEICRTGKFTPPPTPPNTDPMHGAPAGTPLPEAPAKPAPPKLPPGLGNPAPAPRRFGPGT